MRRKISCRLNKQRGIALFAALIFVAVFMAMSVGMLSVSSANTQTAKNHQDANIAMNAALSGLECAKYQIRNVPTFSTSSNTVSDVEANTIWSNLLSQLKTAGLAASNATSVSFTDDMGAGQEILGLQKDIGNDTSFQLRFYRYDDNPRMIYAQSIGNNERSAITRRLQIGMNITKSAEVLQYAIAGRGRIWLTGDTTIHGSIYSSYGKRPDGRLLPLSPFNMTSDSRVEGTINTILTQNEIATRAYQLETLNSDGKPLFQYGTAAYDGAGNPVSETYGPCDSSGYLTDAGGNPVYDAYGMRIPVDFANRLYSGSDQLKGYHEGVNYGQPNQTNIPGLSIADYNTTAYKNAIPSTVRSASNSVISNGVLSTSGVSTVIEYFPHKPLSQGGYSVAASSSSLKLTRYKYENKTLRNVRIASNTNALFKNCTFEEVLYVDCSSSTTSNFNNIRFENCTFNGVIVTNTPSALSWQKNALYFTGSATFDNTSSIQEATILAPHFNVDLGNTNPKGSEKNVLTGAIVGGIVDVRGNAEIYGTIISMADTSAYSSGYVTNIGATLNDGGSETTEIGDVGVIEITPNPNNMLPSGITTPIVIKPISGSYAELRCSD